MKAEKRAALKLAIKRYTTAKKATKALALGALVKEGTHNKKGEITAAYGGERKKKATAGF
ncbi:MULTISPECIES: hypothetical protein [Methylobacterium]|uniref:Uncharacterized protein n=1 Tax=Methylobacterium bullatum TaxID=570505 RepID=A0AAV4Z987_9HYPH|nr:MULTISPECIES: hypothetical protein [Methylobacterium]MBD8904781.1 hypothetical protein [Methylobacterium bullatum]TXN23260.1 hypothetical protein FV220_21270 [Methylobacterium sp. WL19]GJD40168.1 hypothetical protein OICFNHDK_2634 [Methylobacterium bullatum]